MATIIAGPSALAGELTLYHTTDPLLGNCPVLVFHGPAATIGATSSRIQIHIFSPAGFTSYSRLSVSPTSPFYSAVSNLPREEQGDELCRSLAFGLKKYFSELSDVVKRTWSAQFKASSPGALFGDDHIAILATRMLRVDNIEEVIQHVSDALAEQRLSWLDVDVVLPPGAVKAISDRPDSAGSEELEDLQQLRLKYGQYADVVASLGDVTFLPTSKMRRAPSKATAMGRTALFTKEAKEHVLKELTELANTEESYVGRLEELQSLVSNLSTDLKAQHEEQLSEVFPAALGHILHVNSSFLKEVQDHLRSTETRLEERGIESSLNNDTASLSTPDPALDDQGVCAMAKCLCQWFPKFADSYRDYLNKHAQASKTLRSLLRKGDMLAEKLQEAGEQKLVSLLIEPVQRLPRYNLYIDSITKQLPSRHPALKPLLQARDAIIEICADSEASGASAIAERLQSRTVGWPADVHVTGRLITAVDYAELVTPYGLEKCDGPHGMLLLFTDGVILTEKSTASKTTARTLLTELESGTLPSKSSDGPSDSAKDLHFIRRLRLDSLHCLESHAGQVLQLLSFVEPGTGALAASEPVLDSYQAFRLENLYDSKASRFTEELAKARVEARFSETERESAKWEIRATDPAPESLGLFSAIYGDADAENVAARSASATTVILVDADWHLVHPSAGQNGVRTVVKLVPSLENDWSISFESIDGNLGNERSKTLDIVPTIRRKLAALASGRLATEQTVMCACLLGRNSDIMQSIDLKMAPKDDDNIEKVKLATPGKYSRPKSPKKLLSSLLSSVGSGSESHSLLRADSKDLPPLSVPVLRHATTAPPKPPSRESRPSSRDQSAISFSSTSTDISPASHKKLEDTIAAYVLALQARKGNIVGRNLKMRHVADELLVNELYNSLLEDPNMMVLAAQAPLDVLFAAFEKFINAAWKDSLGNIIPIKVMQDILSKAESLFPTDFDEYFWSAMDKLAPQNQRAFRAIMRLLADLLDGTGNDSDRGTLTACFTELLVTDGNPHDYVTLFDRFVDDTDTYFGEPMEEQRQPTGSIYSHKRARSMNSGSITSNTSSLRRKFGFSTLSRENSKSEQESKVTSVWRSLSKTSRSDASPHGSITKASLARSQSIDEGRQAGMRPRSQDGTKPSGFSETPSLLAPGQTASTLGLSTIGEHPSFIPTGPPRKKRRSSLSDLNMLEGTPQKEPLISPSSRRPPLRYSRTEKGLPMSPPSSTPSSKTNSIKLSTPQSARSRLPSSFRKEPSPGPNQALAHDDSPRTKASGAATDEVVITSRPVSSIPSLVPKPISTQRQIPVTPGRSGLSERPGVGNIVKKPSPQPEKGPAVRSKIGTSAPLTPVTSTPGTRKLRMQSPQKLRERLHNEQRSMVASQNTLQDELSKIGEELTSTYSLRTPARGNSRSIGSRTSGLQMSNLDLAQRVLKMEGRLPQQAEEVNARINTIESDVLSSLSVSETRCKDFDRLYREANAENEALYSRFNDDLAKILKAVRGGEGVEELKKKLKESQEEAARLRRETSRLKRENVGLRAQLKE